MESPMTMVMHGFIIGVVLFLIMKFILMQNDEKAIARSVLIGSLSVAYMTAFGHKLPSTINFNKDLI